MENKSDGQDYLTRHRQEVIWQIWLPVGFGAFAMLALGVLAAFSLRTGTDASMRWGHVAAIWLILPLFIIGLFSLILLIGGIILILRLKGILPDYALIVQYYTRLIAMRLHSIADKSVQPIIQAGSSKAAFSRFWLTLYYLLLGGYRD